MVFKESRLMNVDRSGARKVKVFHTYGRPWRRFSCVAEYVKVAVRTIERWPARIRGKRYRPTRIGFVLRCLVCCTAFNTHIGSSFKIKTAANTTLTIKKRGVIKSPYILGPMTRPARVKKFFYIFDTVFFKWCYQFTTKLGSLILVGAMIA